MCVETETIVFQKGYQKGTTIRQCPQTICLQIGIKDKTLSAYTNYRKALHVKAFETF